MEHFQFSSEESLNIWPTDLFCVMHAPWMDHGRLAVVASLPPYFSTGSDPSRTCGIYPTASPAHRPKIRAKVRSIHLIRFHLPHQVLQRLQLNELHKNRNLPIYSVMSWHSWLVSPVCRPGPWHEHRNSGRRFQVSHQSQVTNSLGVGE